MTYVLIFPEELTEDGQALAALAVSLADVAHTAESGTLLSDLALATPALLDDVEVLCEQTAALAIARAAEIGPFPCGGLGHPDQLPDSQIAELWIMMAEIDGDYAVGATALAIAARDFDQIDANGDGRVTERELATFADAGGDGAATAAAQHLLANDTLMAIVSDLDEGETNDGFTSQQIALVAAEADRLGVYAHDAIAAINRGDATITTLDGEEDAIAVLTAAAALGVYANDPAAEDRIAQSILDAAAIEEESGWRLSVGGTIARYLGVSGGITLSLKGVDVSVQPVVGVARSAEVSVTTPADRSRAYDAEEPNADSCWDFGSPIPKTEADIEHCTNPDGSSTTTVSSGANLTVPLTDPIEGSIEWTELADLTTDTFDTVTEHGTRLVDAVGNAAGADQLVTQGAEAAENIVSDATDAITDLWPD